MKLEKRDVINLAAINIGHVHLMYSQLDVDELECEVSSISNIIKRDVNEYPLVVSCVRDGLETLILTATLVGYVTVIDGPITSVMKRCGMGIDAAVKLCLTALLIDESDMVSTGAATLITEGTRVKHVFFNEEPSTVCRYALNYLSVSSLPDNPDVPDILSIESGDEQLNITTEYRNGCNSFYVTSNGVSTLHGGTLFALSGTLKEWGVG